MNYLNNENICREVPIGYLSTENCNLNENKVGYNKHRTYYNCKRPFTVDGYDKTTKTVYLFQGCYWHGCRKCHPENKLNITKQWNKLIY